MPLFKITYTDGNSIIDEAKTATDAYIAHRFDVCTVESVEDYIPDFTKIINRKEKKQDANRCTVN